ncbi:efflux RND transporter periplasmic adaptor subunit [Pseudaestuariivita sp.]|uniref:efflux RND transporter periplasmic adaptor subunit n=1 Tax=Pseudaestuariivita sp. TaxID=2211669 RepID=UPI004059409B
MMQAITAHALRCAARAIVLSALCASASLAEETSPQSGAEARALFVRTMIVGEAGRVQERQFFGRIAALETADLSFQVPGYLSVLDAPRGSVVAKGTQLAALDLDPFERAVERAELTLAQAERDLERSQTLASRNVASEVRAQDAGTARDLAEVALRDAREALADAQLTAPFDGIVADRLVATFTNISPGQPIVRVHNLSETRVEFDLPERILGMIGDPSLAEFSTVLPGQTEAVPLAFREIQAETGRVGQSYTISLVVEGEVPPRVLPGKTVTVTARLPRTGDAVAVPASAVITRPDGQTAVVAVDGEAGVLRPTITPVEVRSTTGVDLLIEGVAPGTEIVELGGHMVGPDTRLARYTGLIVEGN